jgi:hypothetical protein
MVADLKNVILKASVSRTAMAKSRAKNHVK